MTPKQEAFVREYLIDLNATQAAIRAGYSAKTAGQMGDENLKKPEIAAAIAAAMAERASRTEVTADRVVRELARIGFADMRKILKWTGNRTVMDIEEAEETGEIEIRHANLVTLFDSDELDDEIAACISEVSQTKEGALKVKLHDKQAALVTLARHLGMLNVKVEHSGAVDVNHKVKADADAFRSRLLSGNAARGADGGTGETQH